MRLNKYFPFAFIYFFINSTGLPLGLTYTALLGPLFYAWVLLRRKTEPLTPFLAILCPFIIAQFSAGVDLSSYAVSLLNMVLIYFFCQAFYTFLKAPVDHEKIFRRLMIINCILCVTAIVFYFTPYYPFFWIRQNLTLGVDHFLRLKLFTYEASHYALVFVPVFLFFLLQYLLRQNKIKNSWLLLMLFLPLALSFSLGVIGCLLLGGIITFILHFRRLVTKRRIVNSLITLTVLSALSFLVLFLFFRENAFFVRVENIFSGKDLSSQGRTENAFALTMKILQEKNEYWGIGPGQLKIIGEDIIRSYYLYFDKTTVAIPNASVETLLVFGWVGLLLRLSIELFLFFYTRAWSNYYRLLLFLFMFIYQFAGSFITNPAEYVIWILAFTNVFTQFDLKPAMVFTGNLPARKILSQRVQQ